MATRNLMIGMFFIFLFGTVSFCSGFPQYYPGDFDQNGIVDLLDLIWFSQNWLDSCNPVSFDSDPSPVCDGCDLDNNGIVDLSDYALFAVDWLAQVTVTDKYVNGNSGSDSNDGNSPSCPYKTIQKALDNMTASGTVYLMESTFDSTTQGANWYLTCDATNSGADIIIKPYQGASVTVKTQSPYYCILVNGMTGGALTLEDFTLQSEAADLSSTNGRGLIQNREDVSLALSGMTLGDGTTGTQVGIYCRYNDKTTRDITLTDTALNVTDEGIIVQSCDEISIDSGCSITSRGGSCIKTQPLSGVCYVSKVEIHRTLLNSQAIGGLYAIDLDNIYFDTSKEWADLVRVDNCTVNSWGGGITCNQNVYVVLVRNNTVTINHEYDAAVGIRIGKDFPTNSYPHGMTIIYGNTVSFTGSSNSHGILVGSGCDNADCGYNHVSGGDIQLVVKGDGGQIHHNVLYGPRTLYSKEAQRTVFTHNTCYSTDGYAFKWINNGTQDPDCCIVENNIFVLTCAAAADKAVLFNNDDNPFNCRFDYNCYYAPNGADISNLGGARASLAELQAAWASYDFAFTDNDSHSQQADPKLIDPVHGDFTLDETSPCRNAGRPTPNNGSVCQGAWQDN